MGVVRRVHSLKQSFSGPAGEIAVTAALLRCALLVARPYWNNDHRDLIVFCEKGDSIVPISVQSKTLQFKTTKEYAHRDVDGLKKRYVDSDPTICLAIYRPDNNNIWFFAGPDEIQEAYELNRSKTAPSYADIGDADVKVRLYEQPSAEFNAKWLVDQNDASWLSRRIAALADKVTTKMDYLSLLRSTLSDAQDDVPSDGDDE